METSFYFTERQKAAILVVLENIANSDGDFDENEQVIIDGCKNNFLKFDMSSERGLELFREVQQMSFDELIQIIKPLSRLQQEYILIYACKVIAADGIIDDNENIAIGNLCAKLEISPKEFDKIQKKYLKTEKQFYNQKPGCFSVLLLFIISVISIFLFV